MKLSYGYLTKMVSSSLQDILQTNFSVLFNFLWKHFPLHFADLDIYFFYQQLNSTYPLFYIAAGDKNIDEVMFFQPIYIINLKI